MDKKSFKECVERLEEVGVTLEKLPPEVRGAAFSLLEPYIKGGIIYPVPATAPAKGNSSSKEEAKTDVVVGIELFSKYTHDKPADNVKLIAGYFFSEYGSEPISTYDVKERARLVGITIPDRPDVTLGSAVSNGKKLFVQTGRGKFKPTVHGEAFLREAYGIKKGTKVRAETE